MCLTTQAIALFISLLSPEIITPTPTQIVINAEAGPVVWTNFGGQWCTKEPLENGISSALLNDDPGV